jgi:Flp pilus assembly pilin Flp
MLPRSHPHPYPGPRNLLSDRFAFPDRFPLSDRFTPESSRRRPGGAAAPLRLGAPGSARERGARAVALLRDETGAATAEYAVILLAAVGFAGLLLVILRGDDVRGMLTELVHRALTTAG